MKYKFRPYAKMQPTIVTLTGKVYEKGEHPLYKDFKIIEVVDEEGEIHYAFEDEITSDELEQQERSYSEEEVIEFGESIFKHTLLAHCKGVKNLFEQFKKK